MNEVLIQCFFELFNQNIVSNSLTEPYTEHKTNE